MIHYNDSDGSDKPTLSNYLPNYISTFEQSQFFNITSNQYSMNYNITAPVYHTKQAGYDYSETFYGSQVTEKVT